jgi:hypothetical protein
VLAPSVYQRHGGSSFDDVEPPPDQGKALRGEVDDGRRIGQLSLEPGLHVKEALRTIFSSQARESPP